MKMFAWNARPCSPIGWIEESAQKIGCGNVLSHQKQSLPGYHPILHGPSAVMPYVGDVSANIALNEARTLVQWGQPEKSRLHGHHSGLCSTQARSYLSSDPIGCAAGSIYAQLALELIYIHRIHHRNCWSHHQLMLSIFCTTSRIVYVCGSPANANWTCSRFAIHYTYVRTEGPAYKEHFGANEHSYSHWLSLDLPAGWWDLARLLFMHPDAASAAKRDATPLRLLSWLSFRLEPAVEELIEDTMLYLSTAEKVTMADLLSLGTKHLNKECESVEALRDHLIELVSVRNLRHRPEALFALFRQFLQRLTLPRLCHFLDLVLPQLTPVRAPWADATRTLWTCHHIRAVSHENGYPYKPKVAIAYFYTAHDKIHHVRVLWSTLPLLLFSDPRMVGKQLPPACLWSRHWESSVKYT